jgi:hypothetical protein
MKKLILVCLTLIAATYSYAQVKLENLIKPGTRLVYAVNANGSTYDFVVTIKDVNGASFDWEMGSPADQKGTIIHTPKALKEGNKMYNYFVSETKTLDDQTLSVWISQKVYGILAKNTDAVKMCLYDPLDEPLFVKTFGDGEFVIRVNGEALRINDKMVRFAKKAKNGTWVIDQSNDDFFTYYNSATCPIILRMRDKFTLTLKEIKTN